MESDDRLKAHRDATSVWMGAVMLVQPVTYLLSGTAFLGGCIFIVLLGLGNALLLALAFVVGTLAWVLPGIALYIVMGLVRNGLRVQATWNWLSIPLWAGSFGITVLSGLARIAEVFSWAGFHQVVGVLIVVLAVMFWIGAFFGGLLGALRN